MRGNSHVSQTYSNNIFAAAFSGPRDDDRCVTYRSTTSLPSPQSDKTCREPPNTTRGPMTRNPAVRFGSFPAHIHVPLCFGILFYHFLCLFIVSLSPLAYCSSLPLFVYYYI